MVSFVVPCGTQAMKFCWGSAVTSTGILSSIGKSSFMWEEGSILVNMGKHYKRMSSSSRLCTLAWTVGRVCALGVESSPDMVTIFPSSWNGILSTSCVLGTGGDGGIGVEGGATTSLEDEPFLPLVFWFFFWQRNFDSLIKHFLLSLAKIGSQIIDHLFFFLLYLFNNRWHDRLDNIALFDPIRFECLVRLSYDFLSLNMDDNLFLCRSGGRAWSWPRSWTRGLEQSPFLSLLLPSI